MTLEQQFIRAAAQQIGSPYIWGGKGTHLFDKKSGGLVGNPFIGNEYGRPPLLVFDCSGLVTWAWLQTNGKDARGMYHAQGLRDVLLPVQANALLRPHLRYYGATPEKATHVAIAVAHVDGGFLVIEAGGGDQTTTSVLMAERQGAKVRLDFETRKDFLSASVLPV